MRIPVLTYHSWRISGNDYASNDSIALQADLELVNAMGMRIVSLHRIVDALVGGTDDDLDGTVAISFDDGVQFDWQDTVHPRQGPQKSMATVLRRFKEKHPADQPGVHATSFVIASPTARAELDRACIGGHGWWTDAWWRAANGEGLISIENHSWDHNHHALRRTAQSQGIKGSFSAIACYQDADAEVRQATDYLKGVLVAPSPTLFAYPYGEWSDYLVEDYFPRHQTQHGMRAAFTTVAKPIERGDNRWLLPRYVFGDHWRNPGDLQRLLEDVNR